MKRRSAAAYIEDILVHAEKAIAFLAELSDPDELTRDEKTLFAIIRALEVVEQASTRVPDDVRRRFPRVPWRQMSSMRDKLIHDSFESTWRSFGTPSSRISHHSSVSRGSSSRNWSGKKTRRDEGR